MSTEIEMESARKKSKTALGSGTMMTAKITIITPTIVRLLNLTIGSKKGATRVRILCFCFAKIYFFIIFASVIVSKKSTQHTLARYVTDFIWHVLVIFYEAIAEIAPAVKITNLRNRLRAHLIAPKRV